MLRLLLPPNLPSAAQRDAIAVRLEIDLATPPPPALVAGLAVLQRLGAKPAPVVFLQLNRAQLGELTDALTRQPVFFWVNRPTEPIPWTGPDLPGVSEHLVAPAPDRPSPTYEAPVPRNPIARSRPTGTPVTVDGSEYFLAITLPSRDTENYADMVELLKRHSFTLETSNGKFWLRNRHKVLNFLATHWTELRELHRAVFSANFERNTAHFRPVEVTAEISEQSEGYDVTIGLQAGNASECDILSAINSSRSYIEDGKHLYLVDPARLSQLQFAHQALAGSPDSMGGARRLHLVARSRVAEVQEILEETAPHFQPPETWRARSEALHRLTSLAPAPIPAALVKILRPYQRLGTAWLWYLYGQALGGILADEMGLGKTLQALALLAALPRRGPSLIVCPASLVETWRREAARFVPQLGVCVHHGEHRLSSLSEFAGPDLILTSYGTLIRDGALFGTVEFDVILADEAQHLKNRRTQAAQSLRTLRGRGRFLLTGTPLENSLDDLRALFAFLMPGFLPKIPPVLRGDERGWYDERLRAQTAPYILRRTKQAVAPELPAKIEQIIYCEPGPAQAALYRRMQEQTERELFALAANGASEGRLRFATLTQLLRLRQICCDPRLVLGNGAAAGDGPPPESAKLDAFRELLAEALDEEHRLLVFSQFTSLLALLREELRLQDVPCCYLDGTMSARARQAEVDRFQSHENVPVFLISLKAGGTGLNLTGADVVVHFDPWWNPAVEAQATDRAHRIGQTRIVTSYKLICSGTVEEKVLTLQKSKRALLADVFEASEAATAKLSLADLRALLA
ncbi:MAG: DEAD/DEAH box helicase [Opitutaceae bacterium]|nr:DEAD/DEAH box helicase [Opitutaceae bacterium]